jgi:hypothetical protein
MNLSLPKTGSHPSEFALTRFHAGEGETSERQAIQTHLDDCEPCRQVLEELEGAGAAFSERHDRAGFLAHVRDGAEQPDKGAGWLALLSRGWLAGAAAAAAMLVVVLVLAPWRNDPIDQPDSGVRIKADELNLGYMIMEHQEPVVAGADRILHPGNRIQFRLSAPRGGFVHIVSVDAAGQVSVYFPRPGETPEEYPGGSGRPVPGSVILDETLGQERVFALICEAPLSRAKLAERIRRLASDPRLLIDREQLEVDCLQTSLVLVKEP